MTTTHVSEPIEAEIQKEAYLLWLESGRPTDRALDHWLEAKERLRHLAHPAGSPAHDPLHFPPPAATKRRRPARKA